MLRNTFSQPEFDLLDAETKEWIDARSSFLLRQFGTERIRTCSIVLPTTEFFPRNFSETEEHARAMLDRLCGFLGINPQTVELAVFYEGRRPDGGATSLGVYEPHGDHFRIWVEESQLHEPLDLAATMIHELCHVHLLGHGRLTEDADDHEPLTDLLTVFLGLGVITANATLRDVSWRDGGMEGWHISTRGYFTMQMYGYALALFSQVRDEYAPTWSKHLRPDVRHAFRKSLRYFREYGLPELRSVRTTTARPCTTRTDPPYDDSQQSSPSDSENEIDVCTFCGQALPEQDPYDGVCEECQESIEENVADIESEHRAVELAHRRGRRIFRGGIFFMLLLILVLAVLDYLGVIY
jgi:hypothetical protein